MTTHATPRPILAVGSMALDSLETPAGHRADCLGGSATYFGVSAGYFAPVSLVAVVGEDFPRPYLERLSAHGLDLGGVEVVPGGRTFRWRGRYDTDLNNAHTLETQLNVFEQFQPRIPEAQRRAPLVFLGNIDPVLQTRVLDQLDAPGFVAMDTMNFWITSHRPALEQVLARVDLLLVNQGEAYMLSGETNLVRAAEHIRAMGPSTLVIKRGEYGAALFHEEGVYMAPAMPLRDVVDPTGAGDTFAGGLIGYLARAARHDFATYKRAILQGTLMASFACEGFSLDRLLALEDGDIEHRRLELERLITLG
jgi:sugar/nucleoside kinase (ribokinase family)